MAVGDVLGGMAAARSERRRQEFEERKFGLQERQFERQERQFETQEQEASQQKFIEIRNNMAEFITISRQNERAFPGGSAEQALVGAEEDFINQAEESGGFSGSQIAQMRAALASAARTPTAGEAATLTGEAEGIGERAELGAFLGGEATAAQLATKAGVAPPNAVNIARLQQARDQAEAEGRLDDAQQIDAQIQSLGASATFDVRDPRAVLETGAKEDEEVRARLATGVSTLNSLTASLEDIQRVPEAIGPRGAFLEKFGGALDILGLDVLADAIAGGDAPEAIAVRTGLRALTAKLLPILTGDTSGRYTDKEQQIAREIQNTNQLTASARLSEASLRKLIAIEKEADIGEAAKLASRANLDLGTPQGMVRLLKALSDQGFTDDQAEEVARAVFIRGAGAITAQRESDGG